ncbi:MAG: helix-turn-helix domain-containing protein [Campylobacter sp.]|nr:helix-turn-helix domain-containing protein [Campylobacter sp.]
MLKVPIAQAAAMLGISKEAIYNRIRRGSLKAIEKNGQRFVLIDEGEDDTAKTQTNKNKTFSNTKRDDFIKYLLAQIDELKALNLSLQADKDKLFREKENMLIESKKEISAIHKEKDERLMAFLQAMQNPLLNKNSNHDSHKNEVIDAEIDQDTSKWQSLDEAINSQISNKKEKKKISKKIIKYIDKSKFVKFKNGVIYVKKDKNLKQIIGEI